MDDGLIGIQAMAVRAVCGRLTAVQLQQMRHSVEQACLIPKHTGWDRKATAHAEFFALLADSAGDPVLAPVLNLGAGIAHQLMVTAGPSAAGITANSCKRILACLSVGDSDGAAHEVEGYLRVLKFMGRLTATSFRRKASTRPESRSASHWPPGPSATAMALNPSDLRRPSSEVYGNSNQTWGE
jgi:DNA-binding FadR family transcriptional regulator